MKTNGHYLDPEKRKQARELVADGMGIDAIAARLSSSKDTIRWHTRDIEPRVKRPLKTSEITEYLGQWNTVTDRQE